MSAALEVRFSKDLPIEDPKPHTLYTLGYSSFLSQFIHLFTDIRIFTLFPSLTSGHERARNLGSRWTQRMPGRFGWQAGRKTTRSSDVDFGVRCCVFVLPRLSCSGIQLFLLLQLLQLSFECLDLAVRSVLDCDIGAEVSQHETFRIRKGLLEACDPYDSGWARLLSKLNGVIAFVSSSRARLEVVS